jgi:hypothetical protein
MVSRDFNHARAPSAQPDTCNANLDRLALRIPEVCQATGLGRTSVYAAIASGSLCARKWGRSTVVLASDLQLFLECLPKISQG